MRFLVLIIAHSMVLISISAQNTDSLLILLNNYKYEKVLGHIGNIHEDSLDNTTLYLKATALKALYRFPEAIACYDTLYKSDSSNIKIAIELADCHRQNLNYNKPVELYEKALQYDPGNRYIMQLLANLQLATEKFDQAKIWYTKACANDTTGYLLKQIGYCYSRLSRNDSAVYFYLKAIANDPHDYQPVFRLGNIYKDQRKYNEALAITDTFLTGNPENKDVVRLSGYIHYLNQSFKNAIDRFKRSYELADSSLFVNKYLGYSYFKLNEFKNAIRYMEKVYAVDSSDVELCYALALAHDVPQSIRYFNAAIDLGLPALKILPQLYSDLSLALTKDWKYDEALEALYTAQRLAPMDQALVYKIAIHYDNWMDDKKMAVKYYKDFLSGLTDTTSAYIVTPTSVIYKQDFIHAQNRINDIEFKTGRNSVISDTVEMDSSFGRKVKSLSSPD